MKIEDYEKIIHYSLFISVALSVALLTACTLYMDDLEDTGRILRTGEGYDKVETITLPNEQGFVSYKYSQNTIPIDDVVEQYIVKVENDTILYFSFDTPEELLPEVGEMMTCSFRDRFPNAFCHKCIERTEQDGIYRCVFTGCGYDEAFASLTIDMHSTEFQPVEGSEEIPSEEFDSIINEYKASEDEEAEAAARSYNDKATRSPFDTGKREITGINHNLADVSLSPNYMGIVGLSGTVTGGITAGGYVDLYYDSKTGELREEYGLMGQINLTFEVAADAGITFKLPAAIPIAGSHVDLKIVGFKFGLAAMPYIDIRRKASAEFKISYGFDVGVSYRKTSHADKGEMSTTKNSARKKHGIPVFRARFRDIGGDTKVTQSFKAGLDINFGLGGKAAGTGIDVSAGIDLYSKVDLELDKNNYKSAEDFKQKYERMPIYVQPYVQGELKVLGVGVPIKKELEAIPCGSLKMSILPVYKEGTAYFYRSDNNYPYTYKMHAELEELGLFGMFWPAVPKARIYFQEGTQTEPEETFDLKWKDDADTRIMEATKRSDKIVDNFPYIAQFALVEPSSEDESYTIPIQDIPFAIEMPNVEIDKKNIRVSQSLTPKNATYQEQSNPTLIGSKNGQLAWLKNGEAYLYRYKIDVPVIIGAPRLVSKWYIHMANKYAQSTDFSHKEKNSKDLKLQRLLRMTWYSNEQSVYLSFTPSADVQDGKGHEGGNMKFSTCDFTANYYMWLDRQYSSSDQSPDLEKSRSMYDTPWNVATTNLPFGDKPVLGDIELIPIE